MNNTQRKAKRAGLSELMIASQKAAQLAAQARDSLYENIAGISADFHKDSRYDAFYKAHADRLGGFTGIYQVCIEMAKALSNFENSHGGAVECYGGSLDWVELVEAFVDEVMKADEPAPDIEACLGNALSRFI